MVEAEQEQFSNELAKCAAATRSEVDQLNYEVLWENFRHLAIEDWRAMMLKASREYNRFPTVAQLRSCIPRRKSLHDQREERERLERSNGMGGASGAIAGLLTGHTEQASERGSDDIESQIDAMTDEDLIDVVFFPMHDSLPDDRRMKACRFGVKMFRKNPNGAIYRGVVRRAVERMVAK